MQMMTMKTIQHCLRYLLSLICFCACHHRHNCQLLACIAALCASGRCHLLLQMLRGLSVCVLDAFVSHAKMSQTDWGVVWGMDSVGPFNWGVWKPLASGNYRGHSLACLVMITVSILYKTMRLLPVRTIATCFQYLLWNLQFLQSCHFCIYMLCSFLYLTATQNSTVISDCQF